MLDPTMIAGVDEVGRGPLAGPVVSAAVILDPGNPIDGLADSKKLTARQRERLYDEIRCKALCWALGRAEVVEIDKLNILQASLLSMQRAVHGLTLSPLKVLVDGNRCPDLDYEMECIVKGDSKVPAISAASILAKVTRDREMVQMAVEFPGYGFDKHKGYPTALHREQLARLGVTRHHRRSFKPVSDLLQNDQ
jgi:ribonuclease HII